MGQKEQASAPINLDAVRLIRAAFAKSGMTQLTLSKGSGIPRSTLANILSPQADPRLIHVDQLVRIAMALDVDVRDWAGELERLERKRRGPASRRRSPQVQARAARTKK